MTDFPTLADMTAAHEQLTAGIESKRATTASAARHFETARASGHAFVKAAREFALQLRLGEKAAERRAAAKKAREKAKAEADEQAHRQEILAELHRAKQRKALLAEAEALGLTLDDDQPAPPARPKEHNA